MRETAGACPGTLANRPAPCEEWGVTSRGTFRTDLGLRRDPRHPGVFELRRRWGPRLGSLLAKAERPAGHQGLH